MATSKEKPFDPRRNSTVVLNYNEKLPGQSMLIKSAELPVKTFAVGPHKQQRPSTAPTARSKKDGPAHPDPLAPRFLDASGRWIASEMPEQPLATQAQALTASATATAEIVNTMMPKQRGAVRPVSAVYSYNDVSPVITGEFVREAGGIAHMSYTVGGTAINPGRTASPRSILDAAGAVSADHSPAHSPRSPVPQMQRPPSPQRAVKPVAQAAPHKPAAAKPRPASAGQVPQQVFFGTAPYPGGFHASVGSYKEAHVTKVDPYAEQRVTYNKMDYYKGGKSTRPASAGGPYYTGTQSARVVQVKSLPMGTVKPGATTRRGAATTQWQRTQHGGQNYPVNMMQTNDEDGVKVGSVYQTTRRQGSQPHHTGHWTSLEEQAHTELRAGQLGAPLDHPFAKGHQGNPEPYYGGQYTIRKGEHYPHDGPCQDVDGNVKGAAVIRDNYFTHGSVQGGRTHTQGGDRRHANADGPFAAAAENPYWKKQANNLSATDLARAEALGKGVAAGAANARLVGGRWKHITRPVEGDVVYTDYYGPYGKEHANYYGRSYAINTTEFAKNKLVNDSAYQKVRASMMGIQALRDRPGLSLQAELVHGEPEVLNTINQANLSSKTRTLHHIGEYNNLRPDNNTWIPAHY